MIIPNIWENKKCSKPPTRFQTSKPSRRSEYDLDNNPEWLSIVMGVPQWMVYFMDHPGYKWFHDWGYPYDETETTI